MRSLIRRYLHTQETKESEKTVTPDDLEQLKMDLTREIQKACDGTATINKGAQPQKKVRY